MTAALTLTAVLAVASVLWVALPFLREPEPATDHLDEVDVAARELLELFEARDRSLEALRELEADHRAGRIPNDEYRSAVGALRREAAQALRALDVRQERPSGGGN